MSTSRLVPRAGIAVLTAALAAIGLALPAAASTSSSSPKSSWTSLMRMGGMPTKHELARHLASVHQTPQGNCISTCSTIRMSYYGGPVVSNPNVVGVYWGSGTYTPGAQGGYMPGFYNSIGSSSWMGFMSEYDTNVSGGTNQVIGNATAGPEHTISPPVNGTIQDSDIQAELLNLLGSGQLPAPSVDPTGHDNTIYAMYFPDGETIYAPDGSQGGVVWCAYHNTLDYNGLQIPYMVLPAVTPGSPYEAGCGTQSSDLGDFTQVTSHELAESTTDPAVGDATNLAPPLGWYDNTNNIGEVGDACNDQGVLLNGYGVQQIFSNRQLNCVTSGNYVNLSPSYATIYAGQSQAYTATTAGGDVTSSTTFSVTDGSCSGNVCTSNLTGTFQVSGLHSGVHSEVVWLKVLPGQAPGAPTAATATPSDSQASVSWSAPTDNGPPITSYAVTATDLTTPANGGQTCVWSSGPLTCTVTGLVNGDTYQFSVTATNGVGTGPASSPSNPVVPAAVPGPPPGVSATGGDSQATVSWDPAPANGSPIGTYTVTAIDLTFPPNGGQTCVWSGGPLSCTVPGLLNGDLYEFLVTATNGAGTGSASVSNQLVPGQPGQPTGASATGGDTQATVTWSPAPPNGAPITTYTVTATDVTTPANGGQTCAWGGGPLTCTVPGLVDGDTYQFSVTATNFFGSGPASSPSNPVVPVGVPGQPTGASATGGDTQATVSWSPAPPNGSPIATYTVVATDLTTPANGGQTCAWSGGPLSCTVTGLTNGDTYQFGVAATNGVGTGPASSPSNSVVPAGLPGAPTNVSAYPQGANNPVDTVSWQAASDNGSPITGYTVTAVDLTNPANGGQTCAGDTVNLGCNVSFLAFGDTYEFTVTATNGVGTGSASSPSNTVVNTAPPGPPSGTPTATGGNAQATVSWGAAPDNGLAITTYTVTASDLTTSVNGGQTCAWSAGPLSCTVHGLTNGDTYAFTVTATNGDGNGPASSPSNHVVPAAAPGSPKGIGAIVGAGVATVIWSPAAANGSAVTAYAVTATSGSSKATCGWTAGPLQCTLTGLNPLLGYTVSVVATNAIGAGPAGALGYTFYADTSSTFKVVGLPAIVSVGSTVPVLALDATPGSTVKVTVAGTVSTCVADAARQCAVSVKPAKAGVYSVKATDGSLSASSKLYVVTISMPSTVKHGVAFSVKIAHAPASTKVVIKTSDGKTFKGTTSSTGVVTIKVTSTKPQPALQLTIQIGHVTFPVRTVSVT